MQQNTVRFWLGQKQVYGLPLAGIDGEQLVSYHDRFYIVRAGATLLKKGKPVRFTTNSLPAKWKKAIQGDSAADSTKAFREPAVASRTPLKQAAETESGKSDESRRHSSPRSPSKKIITEGDHPVTDRNPEKEQAGNKPVKQGRKKAAGNPGSETVVFSCPYCKAKLDLIPNRKDTKPFIYSCTKCAGDFAVRLVPVTTYQVEIAAFGK